LLSPDALVVSQAIRNRLADTSPVSAMTELLAVMKKTKSNDELVKQAGKGGA